MAILGPLQLDASPRRGATLRDTQEQDHPKSRGDGHNRAVVLLVGSEVVGVLCGLLAILFNRLVPRPESVPFLGQGLKNLVTMLL